LEQATIHHGQLLELIVHSNIGTVVIAITFQQMNLLSRLNWISLDKIT